ncbi:MAG: hypothetical protein HFH62_03005 [Lachnospiraceae bacterium]|nr:hypothetical protein [Lachnospiraceae bacterium]
MRRKFKCVAVYLMCLCVVLGSMCNVRYSFASVSFEQGVREYYEAVNSGDLQALYDTLGGSYLRDAREVYEDQENRDHHVGIFNVKHVEIKQIEKMQDLSKFEIATYDQSVGAVLRVVAKMEVYKEEECFVNGENVFYFVLNPEGKIIGCWNFEEEGEDGASNGGISLYSYDTPIADVKSNPSTIRVKTSGGIVKVDFKKYVKVVAKCEVGYPSWNMNALKACAVAIKNYGIARVHRHKYAGLGYDVKATEADQVYNPNKESVPKCNDAVNAIWDVFWVDAKNRLFPGFHVHSKAYNSYAVKNGGVVSQTKAQELASEKGYSWIKILRFFYDRVNGTAYFNQEVAYGTTYMNVYK